MVKVLYAVVSIVLTRLLIAAGMNPVRADPYGAG